MPFNSSGVFIRTQDWTNDAAAMVKIRADRHDDNDDDIANGLSNCITKNGQTTITADIPFNGHKITNLSDPLNAQDAATKASVDTAIATAVGPKISNMVETLFTTTQTYTKPAGLKFLEIEGCAPGGSGAAAIATAASTWSFGAGGGGGSWGKCLVPAASVPASLTVTIASPGAASSGAGIPGGTSSFGALMSLPGGTGGAQGANTTGTGTARTAPSGFASVFGQGVGGQGSGSDYTIVNLGGLNFLGESGFGMYGGPAPSLVITATSAAGSVAGSGYGSGSGGSINPPSSALKSSLAGNAGFIRIREYF